MNVVNRETSMAIKSLIPSDIKKNYVGNDETDRRQ